MGSRLGIRHRNGFGVRFGESSRCFDPFLICSKHGWCVVIACSGSVISSIVVIIVTIGIPVVKDELMHLLFRGGHFGGCCE